MPLTVLFGENLQEGTGRVLPVPVLIGKGSALMVIGEHSRLTCLFGSRIYTYRDVASFPLDQGKICKQVFLFCTRMVLRLRPRGRKRERRMASSIFKGVSFKLFCRIAGC